MKFLAIGAIWMFGLNWGAVTDAAQPAAEPTKTSVMVNGLVADFYVPADPKGRLPAIIILGGSEGGMGSAAARDGRIIAQQGYAVLQLAYFDAPGRRRTWV